MMTELFIKWYISQGNYSERTWSLFSSQCSVVCLFVFSQIQVDTVNTAKYNNNSDSTKRRVIIENKSRY